LGANVRASKAVAASGRVAMDVGVTEYTKKGGVTRTNAILMWTGLLSSEPEPYWQVLVGPQEATGACQSL